MNYKTIPKDYTMTTTCRTCAYNFDNDNLLPIFMKNHKEIKPIDLIERFHTPNFKLSENDYLPKNICDNCFTNFSIINDFITECEKAEKLLKKYFNKSTIIPEFKKSIIKLDQNSKIAKIKECSVRLKKLKVKDMKKIVRINKKHENKSDLHVSEDCKLEINNSEILNDTILEIENVKNSPDLWNKSNDDFNFSSSEENNIEEDNEIELVKLKNNKMNRINCTICQVSFCEINYLKHMKKHQPLILSECTICKKLVADLEMHKLKQHKIKFICKECGEAFDNRRKYTAHRYKYHEKPGHVCNICKKAFIYLYRLKHHEKTCHSTDTNAICDICGKTFTNPNILVNHRATHIIERKINKNDIHAKQMPSEINTFQCPYCSLKFRNLFGLKNHSKHHKKLKHSESYKHVCEFCSQRFNRSDHLQLHLDLVHLKNLPFSCKYCSMKFPKQYVLNQHFKRKHSKTSHICQYCKKEYAFKVSLTRHIRSHHLMEKRFKCDICGESFITGIQCKKHMENHTFQEERETINRIYGEILDPNQ